MYQRFLALLKAEKIVDLIDRFAWIRFRKSVPYLVASWWLDGIASNEVHLIAAVVLCRF